MQRGMSGVIENEWVCFKVSAQTQVWRLTDKRADVTWSNAGDRGPLLTELVGRGDREQCVPAILSHIKVQEGAIRCSFEGKPYSLVFRLQDDALQIYLACPEGAAVPPVEVLGSGLEAGENEAGEALVPVRMGLLLSAQGEPFEQSFGTYAYEGAHMAMAVMFRSGAALMATWGDPYVTLNVARADGDSGTVLRMGFVLSKTARSLQLRCLGPGDLSTVAAAYRARAEDLGYRVPWSEKRRNRPQVDRLFGASNVKLWTALARRIDEDLVEQSVEVKWTFDEAAQIAEHLRYDLDLDDVLFHLGGWTRYGYDCKHPDIMPANPECGGDEGLIDCARRVQDCGFLFCLHDNVQDMYRDAPSWDEYWVQKKADGSLFKGGVWLGGQAYYTCAREALRLAQRPKNLPLVRDTVHPDLYFIDTTYAVGPQECYDPRHPLNRQEDIHWKQVLSDYARDLFGMFGSECGREWAVPHADFFEGLASVSGRYYHQLDPEAVGGVVVPFFDMVFHDCIAIQGKYGYQPETMGEQVIHHVTMGRTLYYHSLGAHLYWEEDPREEASPAEGPYDPAVFTRAHNGWAEGMCRWDRFIKNTHEILSPLNRLTAETLIERYDFMDQARLVRRTTFGHGVTATVNGSPEVYKTTSALGGTVLLPPYGFLVESKTFAAFHTLSWGDVVYDEPVLFTLSSRDGRPLVESEQVRVFHGFGDARLSWRGEVIEVVREQIVR